MKQILALAPLALLASCATFSQVGPPTASTYRALGTEPFWGLTINPREMVFDDPNGPVRIVQPTPRPIIGIAGEIYRTRRINVNVVHGQCSDGMSDRVYPDKVQVTANGRQYQGCGGPAIPPATLSATNWRVIAVNRLAVPNSVQSFLNFETDRLTANFGCNRLAAPYRKTGDTISAGPVMATRMACPDMRFETQGSAILSRPMQITWSGGDRLTLANERGSIELTRSY